MSLSQIQIIRSLAEAQQWFEKEQSWCAEVARKPCPCFARLLAASKSMFPTLWATRITPEPSLPTSSSR